MSTQSITIRGQAFEVEAEFVPVLKALGDGSWPSIQAVLVALFGLKPAVLSAEAAATVHVFFPDSSYWTKAKARTSADVRKYNHGQLATQDGPPSVEAIHIDGNIRMRTQAADAGDVVADL